MLESDVHKLDGSRTYIDGKPRRYSLLFAVNGGSFGTGLLNGDKDLQPLLHKSFSQLALKSRKCLSGKTFSYLSSVSRPVPNYTKA